MVGPGASEIVLDVATVALVDGASVFILSHISRGGHSNFQCCASDSEEPIEDLMFPNVGSTSDFPSDIAFYFNKRIVASTDGSKMVIITAGGVEVGIPSGQSDRVHVLAPGSSVSVDPPTDLTYGSEVAVIADEGAFGLDLCLPRCACSCTQTHPFTIPMPTLTKKDQTMNGWRRQRRVSVSVFSMTRWYCVVAQGDLKRTIWSMSVAEASACRDAFDLAEYTRAIWYPVVIRAEELADEWKEECNYRLFELVRLLDQRCMRT